MNTVFAGLRMLPHTRQQCKTGSISLKSKIFKKSPLNIILYMRKFSISNNKFDIKFKMMCVHQLMVGRTQFIHRSVKLEEKCESIHSLLKPNEPKNNKIYAISSGHTIGCCPVSNWNNNSSGPETPRPIAFTKEKKPEMFQFA